MNTQPIEKASNRSDGMLEVHSIFHTIQGEGPFSGTPAVFIRLAGCNLDCPQCDTDYTSERDLLTPQQIAEIVVGFGVTNLIVITGGEPFRQKIGNLVNRLLLLNFIVQIETNGTLPPSSDVVWSQNTWLRKGAYIVCSPKSGKINKLLDEAACCFKYVVNADSIHHDGLPNHVLGHGASPRVARPTEASSTKTIYLQPADVKDEMYNQENTKAAIRSCMKNGYVLQLQIHKILGME